MPKHEKYPTWQDIQRYVKDRDVGYCGQDNSRALHQGKSQKKFLVHAFTKAEAEEETQPEPQPQATAGMPRNQDLADMIHAMRGSPGHQRVTEKERKAMAKAPRRKAPNYLSVDAGNGATCIILDASVRSGCES